MKKVIYVCMLISAVGMSQANLVNNGDFDGNVSGWSNNGGGGSGYDSNFGGATLGWWDGIAFWQKTGAVYQADTEYIMTIIARTGDGQMEGVQLNLIDVTSGWVNLVAQDFWFPAEDEGQSPGDWRTFSVTYDTTNDPSVVGNTIGVGFTARDTNDWGQYGWLHVQSVTLVPEPATLLILGWGGLLARRQK